MPWRPGQQGGQTGLDAARPREAGPNAEALDRGAITNVHGNPLTTLHQAAIESEEQGRLFEQSLQQEIEPVIKELSACLMYPDAARVDLGECLTRFETALGKHADNSPDPARHRHQGAREHTDKFGD